MSVLTDADITILNAARGILNEWAKPALNGGAAEARVALRAEIAEHTIFQFLNTMQSYANRKMSYEQLYNAPEPQSLRAPDPIIFECENCGERFSDGIDAGHHEAPGHHVTYATRPPAQSLRA